MTYSLKLLENKLTSPVTLDLAALDPVFSFTYTNPVINFPVPVDTEATTAKDLWNTIPINLNMSSQRVTIDFKTQDGIGVASAPLSLSPPTTTFEKMLYFCRNREPKVLYINNTTLETRFGLVTIERYSIRIPRGGKDYLEHSLSLLMSSEDSPESTAKA